MIFRINRWNNRVDELTLHKLCNTIHLKVKQDIYCLFIYFLWEMTILNYIFHLSLLGRPSCRFARCLCACCESTVRHILKRPFNR